MTQKGNDEALVALLWERAMANDSRMNSWERRFVCSLEERLRARAKSYRLTYKQRAILNRIYEERL